MNCRSSASVGARVFVAKPAQPDAPPGQIDFAAARDLGLPMRGYVSTAFGCPYQGSVDPSAVVRVTGDLLKTTLQAVNETQQAAAVLKTGFENGSGEKTLAEVMIAAQKADLSFRAVTEVRNKLVTAYQDIMNMPV